MQTDISTISPDFLQQRDEMRLPHDLMGGTRAMAAAGTRYVEKGVKETDAAYKERVKRAALLNTFKRTLTFSTGQVFQKPVVLENPSAELETWAEDVDHAGNNLSVWSSKAFTAGLRDGVTFALVDYPSLQTRTGENGRLEYWDGEQWQVKTQAVDKELKLSPYFVHIPAENVIDCWVEQRNGTPVVTHFRYFEYGTESDGTPYGRKKVTRIRVLEAGKWGLYKNNDSKGYELEDSGTTSLDEVPIAIFIAGDKQSSCTASPALIDLAELNRRHWAASCGHCELMEYVRRPVWFGKMLGLTKTNDDGTTETVSVGAGNLIAAEDPSADFGSRGIDPSSVVQSQAELDALKNDMAMYGLQLLQSKSGTAHTATEVSRDTAENNSTLQNWALAFQDFLENCMRFVALWNGEADGVGVKVNTEYSKVVDVQFLITLYQSGILSLQTVQEMLKMAGTLADDFDVEAESEKLARGVLVNGTASGTRSLADALGGF